MRLLICAVVATVAVSVSDSAVTIQPRHDRRNILENAQTIEERFKNWPESVPGPVDAFEFEISLRLLGEEEYNMQWHRILMTVSSTRMISSGQRVSSVEVTQSAAPGLIDLTAKKLTHGLLNGGFPRRMFPEKHFQARLGTLHFANDRPIYLRLRFGNAEELFALTFDPNQGLRLVGIKNRFGKVADGSIKEFTILEAKDGARVYRCDNLTVLARDDEKELWSRPLPLQGAPKELKMVGDTLLVLSTDGHSLYLRKKDGKIVLYHKGILAGKSLWDEILEVARKTYRQDGGEKSDLYKYMRAAALLEKKRAAPFLIECIEKGFGLSERWLAVAVLEHLNGNSEHWKALGEGQPWDLPRVNGTYDMSRVYPNSAAKAEAEKWEKVFGKLKEPLLTRREN